MASQHPVATFTRSLHPLNSSPAVSLCTYVHHLLIATDQKHTSISIEIEFHFGGDGMPDIPGNNGQECTLAGLPQIHTLRNGSARHF